MTVQDLILQLQNFAPDTEVMILDSFNGAGVPREINLEPHSHTVSEQDGKDTSDCEGKEGHNVVVMGYGFY